MDVSDSEDNTGCDTSDDEFILESASVVASQPASPIPGEEQKFRPEAQPHAATASSATGGDDDDDDCIFLGEFIMITAARSTPAARAPLFHAAPVPNSSPATVDLPPHQACQEVADQEVDEPSSFLSFASSPVSDAGLSFGSDNGPDQDSAQDFSCFQADDDDGPDNADDDERSFSEPSSTIHNNSLAFDDASEVDVGIPRNESTAVVIALPQTARAITPSSDAFGQHSPTHSGAAVMAPVHAATPDSAIAHPAPESHIDRRSRQQLCYHGLLRTLVQRGSNWEAIQQAFSHLTPEVLLQECLTAKIIKVAPPGQGQVLPTLKLNMVESNQCDVCSC
jgi:hypothetical protein